MIGELEEISPIGAGELTVEWRVRDVLSLPGGTEDGYLSTDFNTGGERWRLRLYPNWYREAWNPASGWLRVGLVKYDGGPRKNFHFSVGILGSGGVEMIREGEKEFWGHDEYFWNEYCSRCELMERKSTLMPDNVLKVRCVINRTGAATDNDLRKKEVESFMGQTNAPQKPIENDELESESYKRQISVLENEMLSIPEENKCLLGEKLSTVSGLEKENEELPVKMKSLKVQTEGYEKISDRYCLQMSNYERKNRDLENKFSNEKVHEEHTQSSLTAFSEHEKVNEQLKTEVKPLMEQNKNLNEKCEQTPSTAKASSELRKAYMDYVLLKKEMESLMEQMENLKWTVENYPTLLEDYCKRIRTLESESISSTEQSKYQEKLTFVSGLKKDSSIQTDNECKDSKFLTEESQSSEKQAAFDDDAVDVKNNENNDEDHEESENEKNVKQLSQVKSTKKISLPSRHGGVIRSLKSIRGRRADFTLKSGGREWPVHRSILEGRSGHFESLFRGEWAVRDELRLEDVVGVALDGVLQFVYAGEVEDLSVENVKGIYVAAHQFLLDDLKSLCVEYMKERMCPELVCCALAIAEAYGEGDLKKIAMECFFRECPRIFELGDWTQFKENHLAIVEELLVENFKRKRGNRGQ